MVFHLCILCNCCWLGGKHLRFDSRETLCFSALQVLANAQALLFLKPSDLLLGFKVYLAKLFRNWLLLLFRH